MYNNFSNYPNYDIYDSYPNVIYNTNKFDNDDRIIGGGVLAPFILGGIAGAALAPNFYRPYCCYPPFFFPPQRRFFW